MCSKAVCAKQEAECVSPGNLSTPLAERIYGLIALTARLRTSSISRIRLPSNVVGAIEPKLLQAEIDRANRKPTENLDAYDFLPARLSGGSSIYQGRQ